LDDIIEYGWGTLSRAQQIGLKFYEDFGQGIPRPEVESISSTILMKAREFCSQFQMVIVGGYRRGKEESGDVDVVLSNPDESKTLHFVEKLVVKLEKSKFITHTLTLSMKNSERGQMPVSWKAQIRSGSGFDTLDKALVVWHDPGKDAQKKARLRSYTRAYCLLFYYP
jgi:DNA polymerase IV